MGMGIHCCKDCVPPKRYPGCHAACKDYIKAKAQLEEDKKKARTNQSPVISIYDFNESDYVRCKRRKHKR